MNKEDYEYAMKVLDNLEASVKRWREEINDLEIKRDDDNEKKLPWWAVCLLILLFVSISFIAFIN